MALLLGHTMGTPGFTISKALDLFAASGLDGVEIIWQNDYTAAIPEYDTGQIAARVKREALQRGLRIGCLTPYITELNHLDEGVRQHGIERFRACIRTAAQLDCPRIRVYGGALLDPDVDANVPRKWSRLVDALGGLGGYAVEHGVILCVENHFGTMAASAEDTARLVAEVDSPGVGILYDQANLTFTHREDFEQAIRVQGPWIKHVHVKDLVFIHPDRVLTTGAVTHIDKANRVHRSRMIGDGILDWPGIVERLRSIGYDGSYSLEYEYRWNPEDLPEPAIGFPESGRRLRALFGGVAGGPVPVATHETGDSPSPPR